jgi:hypothetical protein
LDLQRTENLFFDTLISVPAFVAILAEHVKDKPRLIGLPTNAPVKLPEWNEGAHSHGFPRLRLILAEQARPAAIGRAKILTAIPHQFCYSLICHAHLEKFARPDVLPTSKPGKPHSLEGRMFCLCGLCGALGTRNFNLEKDRA